MTRPLLALALVGAASITACDACDPFGFWNEPLASRDDEDGDGSVGDDDDDAGEGEGEGEGEGDAAPSTGTWRFVSSSEGRDRHSAVWTGNELLVFAGDAGAGVTSTGIAFDPASGALSDTPAMSAGQARLGHVALWTGTEMFVFGGNGGTPFRYERGAPTGADFHVVTLVDAPRGQLDVAAAWTGTEAIVWGGISSTGGGFFNEGARYDPVSEAWTPMSFDGAPQQRGRFNCVAWTGGELVLLGPGDAASGGAYDPASDSWRALSDVDAPPQRFSAAAAFTGSEIVVWSGYDPNASPEYREDGGVYDVATDSWRPMSTSGAPAGRERASAVWTGTEMIVFGGINDDGVLADGGVYHLADDAWRPLPPSDELEKRVGHTATWTGTEMILWGGWNGLPFDIQPHIAQRIAIFTP